LFKLRSLINISVFRLITVCTWSALLLAEQYLLKNRSFASLHIPNLHVFVILHGYAINAHLFIYSFTPDALRCGVVRHRMAPQRNAPDVNELSDYNEQEANRNVVLLTRQLEMSALHCSRIKPNIECRMEFL